MTTMEYSKLMSGIPAINSDETYQQYTTSSKVVIWFKIFQAGKTIEIQLVRPTEVCGKI